MSRRLRKTLVDYMVIAVNPVLIMFLIGSLVYFLIEVFYQGRYEGRLHYIFALFIMAAVLIGRISIEEGKERAGMFAVPLAVVTYLALFRFVAFQGALAGISWLLNLGLIGLIWWAAHKLTWDCTLIDDEQDASGEGLLQTAGLEERARARQKVDQPEKPEGVTGAGQPEPTWWERLGKRDRRPHAPGLWIIYVSLVAVPIFAFGQILVPADDSGRRGYLFFLFLIYAASGLGLLMNTSFLGLRRYLRQRRVEMPPAMAGTWLTVGCGLIVALLAAAALVPRPNAEYAWADLSLHVGSPVRDSSRFAPGGEAADRDRGGPRSGSRSPDDRPGEEGEEGDRAGRGRDGQSRGQAAEGQPSQAAADGRSSQGQGQSGRSGRQGQSGESGRQSGPSGRQSGRGAEGRQGATSESSASGGRKGQGAEGGTGQTDRRSGRGEGQPPRSDGQAARDPRRAGQRPGSDGQQAERRDGHRQRPSDRAAGGESQGDDSQTPAKPSRWSNVFGDESQDDASPQSPESDRSAETAGDQGRRWSFRPWSVLQTTGGVLFGLLKWAIFLVLIGIGLVWIWRSRRELLQLIRDLIAGWREFLARLFGRRPPAPAEAPERPRPKGPRLPRFADYTDPFLSGAAERWSPDEVVRYTFEALEAWGRDRGCPRSLEETPYEFARKLGRYAEQLADGPRRLADLYYQVAYAPGTVPASSVAGLRNLWLDLEQHAPQPVATTAVSEARPDPGPPTGAPPPQ